ncbi:Molybdopterin binding motif CinA N-terminaldomain / C-terminal domain of CinA type E [Salmonella enterica subsp. enterica]|uniref:Molybdopterin binding motif CinA N-terminaldomain / C-terminal domain of CinA type E n=1 Tax=Salmonella enterica I TaxID=59201 RepID=A0A379WRD9_SALET|nr:Molybdopterin binding motif CinA N-terminaldomain / C-terminal domain of CinA type E [Salmonella enterica subsp. enterica]
MLAFMARGQTGRRTESDFEGTENLPAQIARRLQERQLSLTLSEQYTSGLLALQLSRAGAPVLASEVVPSQEETLAQTAHWTTERRSNHYAGLALAVSGLENEHLNFALATPDGTYALRVRFSANRYSLAIRQGGLRDDGAKYAAPLA